MKTYIRVWLALLLLLALTVEAAYLRVGVLNPVLAVGIAVVKALLIATYFMHLRSAARVVWIVAAAGVVWLVIMFVGTAADYLTRSYLPQPAIWQR